LAVRELRAMETALTVCSARAFAIAQPMCWERHLS
jgi:hypothetical protein